MADGKSLLAEKHLGLVHACCKRFSGRGIEYEELYAAGCLGLVKAINNFNSSLGYQFSTYAFPLICGEIKRLFRDGGAVRVSRPLRELALKITRLNDLSLAETGRELTLSELSKRLDVPIEKISEAMLSARPVLSITADSDSEDGSRTDIPVPDIQEDIAEKLTLEAAIDSLEASDRALVNLRYFKNKTQAQTAEILHMTQVQVSRREKKILARIREKMICC